METPQRAFSEATSCRFAGSPLDSEENVSETHRRGRVVFARFTVCVREMRDVGYGIYAQR